MKSFQLASIAALILQAYASDGYSRTYYGDMQPQVNPQNVIVNSVMNDSSSQPFQPNPNQCQGTNCNFQPRQNFNCPSGNCSRHQQPNCLNGQCNQAFYNQRCITGDCGNQFHQPQQARVCGKIPRRFNLFVEETETVTKTTRIVASSDHIAHFPNQQVSDAYPVVGQGQIQVHDSETGDKRTVSAVAIDCGDQCYNTQAFYPAEFTGRDGDDCEAKCPQSVCQFR